LLKLTKKTITAVTAAAILAGSLASASVPASAASMNLAPAVSGAQSGASEDSNLVTKVRHHRRWHRHHRWHGRGWVGYYPYYGYGYAHKVCKRVKFKKWSPRRGRYIWRVKHRCFYPSY